jgi:hypothetical protein
MATCQDCGCKDGQRGPVGPQGPQGDTGATGATGASGPQGPAGLTGSQGPVGAKGSSAYQVWLDDGNVGTETDFLNSLKGPAGPAGPAGAPGAAGTNGVNGVDGVQGSQGPAGPSGDSAYEVWLNQGNTGSEQDFLDSIAQSALPTFSSWIPITPAAGWTVLTVFEYCYSGELVMLRGNVSKDFPDGLTVNDVIGTLPAGIRPSQPSLFQAGRYSQATSTITSFSSNEFATIGIYSNGEIRMLTAAVSPTNGPETFTFNFSVSFRGEL